MRTCADVLASVCASGTEARECLLTQVLCPHADVAHVFECGLHVLLPRLRNVRHCKGTARHARVTGANHVSKRACVQGRSINAELWPHMGTHVSAAAESAQKTHSLSAFSSCSWPWRVVAAQHLHRRPQRVHAAANPPRHAAHPPLACHSCAAGQRAHPWRAGGGLLLSLHLQLELL
jgi:hypothetical protein